MTPLRSRTLPLLLVACGALAACAGSPPAPAPAPVAAAAAAPINATCPRSGKPVAADSLTTYRGHVVGFCNTRCRDDFAADPGLCPADRAFFDALIASLE